MSNFYLPRRPLSRRHFLRGVGVAMALPLLDAMTPLGAAEAVKPRERVRLHSQRRKRHDLAGDEAGPRL